MALELTIDAATLREQITLLRGALGNRKLTGRQRYLITDLLRLLNTLEAATPQEAAGCADPQPNLNPGMEGNMEHEAVAAE